MLPIFRIISVGGVTLAITILVLALIPPGGTRLVRPQHDVVVARGPLMDSGTHPEWRQFLIHAALRRAGELERLRDLRDTIVRTPDIVEPGPEFETTVETPAAPDRPLLAGLTSGAENRDPEEFTGSIGRASGSTIPIEIGEASSTELPVASAEETPPVIRLPALQMPSLEPMPAVEPPAVSGPAKKPEMRSRAVQQRPRRKPPAAPEPQPLPPPFNILAAIFGSLANAPQPTGNRQALNTRAVTR